MGLLGNGFGFTNLTFAENEDCSPRELLHASTYPPRRTTWSQSSAVAVQPGFRAARE